MKLIDKDALVAEIDKEIKHIYAGREYVGIPSDEGNMVYGLQIAKGIIDTLEVKEVDLERKINDYFITVDLCEGEKITENTFRRIAKHFFELGLKAQKGEEL